MEGLSHAQLEEIRQTLLLGTSRRPLTLPPALAAAGDTALAALALAGQHGRFERLALGPAHETPAAAAHLHSDPRPILGAKPRRMLTRLVAVTEKGFAASVVTAAVRRIAARGFRLHPFDLPHLAQYLKGEAIGLGRAERAFLALSENVDAQGRFDEEITPDNWTEAPKAQRRAFLRQQRAADSAGARGLLESAFAGLAAADRADLLGVLAVGIGPEDRPFLESLGADRADSVRAAATAMLQRILGAPGYAERLAAAVRCFQRQSGALKKLAWLVGAAREAPVAFAPPDGANAREQQIAALSLFEGLPLPQLARESGLTPDILLGALPEDDMVFWALHRTAVSEGDAATLLAMTAHKMMADNAYPTAPTLTLLADACPAPLSNDAAARLLASARWAETVASCVDAQGAAKDDGRLIATALLLPASAMPAFVRTLEPLPAGARSARAFAEFVVALDADEPASPPKGQMMKETP